MEDTHPLLKYALCQRPKERTQRTESWLALTIIRKFLPECESSLALPNYGPLLSQRRMNGGQSPDMTPRVNSKEKDKNFLNGTMENFT